MSYTMYCIEGFDKLTAISDLAERGHWTTIGAGLTYQANGGRNGEGCLRDATTGSAAARGMRFNLQNRPDNVVGNLQTIKIGFAFRINFSSHPSTSQIYYLATFTNAAGASTHGGVRLFYSASNWVIQYFGTFSTTGFTIGPTLTSGRWYHVEMEVSDFRDSNGSSPGVQSISVNGTTPANTIGVTSAIASGSSQNCGAVILNGTTSLSHNLAAGESLDYDDFHCGGIGAVGTIPSPNTNMLGDSRVDYLAPVSDGFHNDFTPLSGSDQFAMVGEEGTNDGDTSYTYSGTLNHKVSVLVEALPHNPTTIHRIHPFHVAKREGSGSRSSRSFIRVSGTDYEGNVGWDLSHGTTYQGVWMNGTDTDLSINPATTVAYTKTDLQSIEIGVKVQV